MAENDAEQRVESENGMGSEFFQDGGAGEAPEEKNRRSLTRPGSKRPCCSDRAPRPGEFRTIRSSSPWMRSRNPARVASAKSCN